MVSDSRTCDAALVTEDMRPRSLILAELEGRGLSVCAWPDVSGAVRGLLAGDVEPRVVVLDLSAGGITSEKARHIIHALSTRKVIALTGVYGAGGLARAATGAFRVLARPFRVDDVVQAVLQALEDSAA